MDIKKAFGRSLQQARLSRGLSQEDFSIVSSRTYVSTLERGLQGPTLEKVDTLSALMGLHPLTLLTMTYLRQSKETDPSALLRQINKELKAILGRA